MADPYKHSGGDTDGSVNPEPHDPADVEYMARLFCTAYGEDPDHEIHHLEGPPNHSEQWRLWQAAAIRALDYLQARGEKVTTRNTSVEPIAWCFAHDDAPMTPRD